MKHLIKGKAAGKTAVGIVSAEIIDLTKGKASAGPRILKDSINHFLLHGSSVYAFYANTPKASVYNMLNYIKPDCIVLHAAPVSILESPLIHANNVIRDLHSFKDLNRFLSHKGFSVQNSPEVFNPLLSYDPLPEIHCSLAAMWALNHPVSLYTSDIAEETKEGEQCRSTTLLQLEHVFRVVMKIHGETRESFKKVLHRLYPNFWMDPGLTHAGSLINALTNTYKTLFCIFPLADASTLQEYCKLSPQASPTSLKNANVLRIESSENVIEKLALLHILHSQDKTLLEIAECKLPQIRDTIRPLVEDERKSSNYTLSRKQLLHRGDYLEKLYVSMLKKHITEAETKTLEGTKVAHTAQLIKLLS